jgi:hypothetical protein
MLFQLSPVLVLLSVLLLICSCSCCFIPRVPDMVGVSAVGAFPTAVEVSYTGVSKVPGVPSVVGVPAVGVPAVVGAMPLLASLLFLVYLYLL